MARLFPHWLLHHVGAGRSGPRWLVALLVRLPQWQEERRQRAQRRLLQKMDAQVERELFVGIRGE
jgi:hypothetical protein